MLEEPAWGHGAGWAAKRHGAARHRAAVFRKVGTGILIGMELCWGLRCSKPPAPLTQDIQLLPQSPDISEIQKGVEHMGRQTHSWAARGIPPARLQVGEKQTALPCPALWHLLQHHHGARHPHSALSRAPMAKHSSFSWHCPSQGFSKPCNYPARIKGVPHTSESPESRAGFTSPTPTCSPLTPGFPFLALLPAHPGLCTAAGCLDLLQRDVLCPRSAPERF